MKERVKVLKPVVEFELHDHGDIPDGQQLVHRLIVKERPTFRDNHHPGEMLTPELAHTTKPDANVRAFLPELNEQSYHQ